MGSSYFKNYFGAALTDAEFEDIPYPNFELQLHIVNKCVQAGCLFGTTIACGNTLVKGPRKLPFLLYRTRKYAVNGSIGGLAIGPMIHTIYVRKVKHLDEDAIRDRCYRLRHNRTQVRVDRGAYLGSILGFLAAFVIGRNVVNGLVFGMNTGIISTAVVNCSLNKK